MLEHTFEETKLKTGAQGLLINIPNQQVFRIEIGFIGGTLHCPADKREIAHGLEHMVFKANETYASETELQADISKYGATSNAYTGNNILSFVYRCPQFDWQRILAIAIKTITTPLLLEKHLRNELKVIEEELMSGLNRYPSILVSEMNRQIFGYDLSDKTRLNLLKNLSIEDLRNFYSRIFNHKNMYFIVMGDLDNKMDKIEQFLTNMQFNSFKDYPANKLELIMSPPKKLKQPIAIDCPEVKKIYFQIKLTNPVITPYAQIMPGRVLVEILTGVVDIFNSRINRIARDKGLTYGIYSSCTNIDNDSSSFSIWGTVSEDNVKALFDLIADVIKQIKLGQLTDQEVDDAKQKLLGVMDLTETTTSTLMNWYDDYAICKCLNMGVEHYNNRRDLVKSVTKQDVLKYFDSVTNKDLWFLGLLGSQTDKYKDELYAKIQAGLES